MHKMQNHKSPEKIHVKNARGVIQCLSPRAFQKKFAVSYTSTLLIDSGCPPPGRTENEISLRKVPSECRREFFQKQFVKINDVEAWDGGAMKEWLYGDQIRQARVSNIYIAKVSDYVGYGAFALEEIPPGQILGEYTGLARALKDADCSNLYVFNYVHNAIIDASKRGNISRFINHSEHGANSRYMRVLLDGVVHVILLAERTIRKDEQILLNYGADYWHHRSTPRELSELQS